MIGLGIDAVDVPRFREVLARRPGLAERLFTTGERSYAAGLADPMPCLAARFAAKEATMKALGVGLGAFRWTDVEVVRRRGGRPSPCVTGRRRRPGRPAKAWRAGSVSLTHTASLAEAVVAALS